MNRRELLETACALAIAAALTPTRAESQLLSQTAPRRSGAPSAIPPPTQDQWQRLDQPRSGGASGFYFSPAAVVTGGKIFHAWNGTRLFNPSTGLWENQDVPVGQRENCAAAFDPDLNRVWIMTGNPPGNPPGPPPGEIYYDIASRAFARVKFASRGATHDQAMGYYNGRLYKFGGYGPSGDAAKLQSKPTNPEDAWTLERAGGNDPFVFVPGDQRASQLTFLRGGVDRRNGQVWWLGPNNEFWIRGDNGRWNLIPTLGTKPPAFCVAALNEDRDSIVTFCGKNKIAGDDPPGNRTLGVTHVLPLSTLLWRQSTTQHSIPMRTMCEYVLVYNFARKKVTLLTGDGVTCGVWEFTEGS